MHSCVQFIIISRRHIIKKKYYVKIVEKKYFPKVSIGLRIPTVAIRSISYYAIFIDLCRDRH